MYQKDFDGWQSVKQRIEDETRKVHIRASEIRWIALGVNIGSEMDGKGASFTRPALVLHVIGARLALVVPMTSQLKNRAGYLPFEWKGAMNALCIHQMRVISQKRILSRRGRISTNRLAGVKAAIVQFYRL